MQEEEEYSSQPDAESVRPVSTNLLRSAEERWTGRKSMGMALVISCWRVLGERDTPGILTDHHRLIHTFRDLGLSYMSFSNLGAADMLRAVERFSDEAGKMVPVNGPIIVFFICHGHIVNGVQSLIGADKEPLELEFLVRALRTLRAWDTTVFSLACRGFRGQRWMWSRLAREVRKWLDPADHVQLPCTAEGLRLVYAVPAGSQLVSDPESGTLLVRTFCAVAMEWGAGTGRTMAAVVGELSRRLAHSPNRTELDRDRHNNTVVTTNAVQVISDGVERPTLFPPVECASV